jgi:nucleotide-binding universal stress UspA family protein
MLELPKFDPAPLRRHDRPGPRHTSYPGAPQFTSEFGRLQAQTARVAAEKLERLVRQVGVSERRRHLVGRHPTDAIEQVAAETRSALVVMGAISRSGLKRLLIGNTAERVLDHLTCDVLVIKPVGLIKRLPRTRRPVRYSVV